MPTGLKRLRLFMTSDAVGGVFTYALDLAAALSTHGVETRLALLGPGMSSSQRRAASATPGLETMETGLPLDWMAADEAVIRRAAQRLAGLARAHGSDLVHLNAPALAIAKFHAPVVAVSHSCVATWWRSVRGGAMPQDFRWRSAVMAEGLNAADVVVCASRSFAETTARTYRGVTPHVVHNGRRTARTRRSIGTSAAVALTAGRLWDEAKDVATLDQAAARMSVPLHAAGSLTGPNGTHAECKHLRRLGQLSQTAMRRRLAERPIFVSAARYEPFGLGVLEAAQAGCALVLADIPTFRELWGDAALFVAPGDAAGFATAIERLARDPTLRARQESAALLRSRAYTLAAMAQRMLEVYAPLLGQAGAREAAA